VIQRETVPDMRPLMRLECEPKSGAILGALFISTALRQRQNTIQGQHYYTRVGNTESYARYCQKKTVLVLPLGAWVSTPKIYHCSFIAIRATEKQIWKRRYMTECLKQDMNFANKATVPQKPE
jgi:hypothetical protein